MAEITLIRRPALAHSPIGAETSLYLEPLPEGHVLHALAAPNAVDVTKRLARVSDGTAHAVRAYAPSQWFVVGDSALTAADVRGKAAALGTDMALSDQSHGRVRLAVSGPQARLLLAKGSAVDFSARMFPLGRSAATLFNHIGLHVTRTGNDRFELMAPRSFAESLWEELVILSDCHRLGRPECVARSRIGWAESSVSDPDANSIVRSNVQSGATFPGRKL
jgi:sarcosine oxidase, subunit gamma